VQTLRGVARAHEAGAAFTAIADAALSELFPVVVDEFARRHGPPPGAGAAVVGMGKLGSAEMTATSDLDLLFIYDPARRRSRRGRRSCRPRSIMAG
jgi:glutamate-ammonia-ligase adenylyltransferase